MLESHDVSLGRLPPFGAGVDENEGHVAAEPRGRVTVGDGPVSGESVDLCHRAPVERERASARRPLHRLRLELGRCHDGDRSHRGRPVDAFPEVQTDERLDDLLGRTGKNLTTGARTTGMKE